MLISSIFVNSALRPLSIQMLSVVLFFWLLLFWNAISFIVSVCSLHKSIFMRRCCEWTTPTRSLIPFWSWSILSPWKLLLLNRTRWFLLRFYTWSRRLRFNYFFRWLDWRLIFIWFLKLSRIDSKFLKVFLLPLLFLLLLSFSNVVIKGLTILSYWKFFIIIHTNIYRFFTRNLLLLIVKIFYIRMS